MRLNVTPFRRQGRHCPKGQSLRRHHHNSRDLIATQRQIESLAKAAVRSPAARQILHDALLEASDIPGQPLNGPRSLAEEYAEILKDAEHFAKTYKTKEHVFLIHNPFRRPAEGWFRYRNKQYPKSDEVLVYVSRAGRQAKPTRLNLLRDELPEGWKVFTWSPGDGVTRYRFFENPPVNQTYFGPDNGRYTALGLKRAHRFVEHVHAGTWPRR